MTKNSQLLVIVFISTAQLALTLLAVAWLFGWIHDRTQEIAQRHVSDNNQFIASQIRDRVAHMGLTDIDVGSQDWNQLQEFVTSTQLPDSGFVSILDATSGEIICHPLAKQIPDVIGKTWDSYLVGDGESSFLQSYNQVQMLKKTHVVFDLEGIHYVVQGRDIPELNIIVLVHQKVSGIHSIDALVISSLKRFSFAIALIIGLLGTVLNFFMVRRIVDVDKKIQAELEDQVDQRTEELNRTKNAIIFGLAKLAESRDNDTGEHLDRIRKYVTILANDLSHVYNEIDESYIYNLGIASSLHDIGKVGIPDSILLKPGKLTHLERSIMEKHTIIGGECLEAISSKLGDNDFLEMAREVAFWHHEQWDGHGYPHRLADDEIPISARIVAVADVYDALTSRRPYKRGMSHSESRAIIISDSGQKFDPEVVAAFLRHESEFQQVARRYQNTDFEAPVTTIVDSDDANNLLVETLIDQL